MPVGSFKLLTYIDLFLLKSAIVVNTTRIFLGFVINRTMIFAIKNICGEFFVCARKLRPRQFAAVRQIGRNDELLPVRIEH